MEKRRWSSYRWRTLSLTEFLTHFILSQFQFPLKTCVCLTLDAPKINAILKANSEPSIERMKSGHNWCKMNLH